MTLNKSLMSSKRDSWNTPQVVVDLVKDVFDGMIMFDPCSNADSVVGAEFGYSKEHGGDGLAVDWSEYQSVYVNPPYSRAIGTWVDKCNKEHFHTPSMEIIALLPARPDTRWFESAWEADALCFWRGRLRFLGAPASAPFPSVVAYWGPRKYRFADVFSEVGKVVFP